MPLAAETSLAVRSGMKYGYALGLGSDLAEGFAAYGNAGSIAGFLSAYRYIPSIGAGYFFAINSSTPDAIAARPEINVGNGRLSLLGFLIDPEIKTPKTLYSTAPP